MSRLVHLGLQTEARQQVLDLGDDFLPSSGHAPEIGSRAVALGDGETERFGGRQMREQLIDLKRARQAAPHAAVRREGGDVAALENDLTLGRLDDPGQKIDQRRLARAVGADQRPARARRQAEGHVVGGEQGAETPRESPRLERRRAHAAPRPAVPGMTSEAARTTASRTRSRPISTSATRSAPIQNSQYSGVAAEITSRSTMNIAAPIRPP